MCKLKTSTDDNTNGNVERRHKKWYHLLHFNTQWLDNTLGTNELNLIVCRIIMSGLFWFLPTICSRWESCTHGRFVLTRLASGTYMLTPALWDDTPASIIPSIANFVRGARTTWCPFAKCSPKLILRLPAVAYGNCLDCFFNKQSPLTGTMVSVQTVGTRSSLTILVE